MPITINTGRWSSVILSHRRREKSAKRRETCQNRCPLSSVSEPYRIQERPVQMCRQALLEIFLSISAFALCIENSSLIRILTYILLYDIIRTSIQCTFYTNEEL